MSKYRVINDTEQLRAETRKEYGSILQETADAVAGTTVESIYEGPHGISCEHPIYLGARMSLPYTVLERVESVFEDEEEETVLFEGGRVMASSFNSDLLEAAEEMVAIEKGEAEMPQSPNPKIQALLDYEMPPAPSHHEGAKTYYISGPMTGIDLFNYPAFFEAEQTLDALGFNSINPARLDREKGIDEDMVWHDFLKRDMQIITQEADGMAFLDGWRNSRGATLEGYVAQQAGLELVELLPVVHPELGVVDYTLESVESVTVAYEAQSIVLGARRYDYGHPLDNFLHIARLWNATFGHKLKEGEALDVRDIAMAMAQVKIAREYNAPKRDNRVDIIGYTLAYDESINESERRGQSADLVSEQLKQLRENAAEGFNKTNKE